MRIFERDARLSVNKVVPLCVYSVEGSGAHEDEFVEEEFKADPAALEVCPNFAKLSFGNSKLPYNLQRRNID